MLDGMRSDELLDRADDLYRDDRYAEVVRLVAPHLLDSGDRIDGELAAQLGKALLSLGHQRAAITVFAAAGLDLPAWELDSWTGILRERGDDQQAIAVLLSQLAVDSEFAPELLAAIYEDYDLPASRLIALRASESSGRAERRARLLLWWRTGGPLWFLRSAMLRREQAHLLDLEIPGDPAPDLGTVLRAAIAGADRDQRALAVYESATTGDDTPLAAQNLAKGLRDDDTHPLLLNRAVDIAESLNRPGLALALCQRLADQDPDFGGLAARRGALLLEVGRLEPARDIVERVSGRSDSLRALKAQLLLEAGFPFHAVDTRGRVERWERGEWRALWWRTGGPLGILRRRGLRGEWRVALGRDQPAPESPPDGGPADWLERLAESARLLAAGEKAAEEDRPDEAIALLRATTAEAGSDVSLLNGLAQRLSAEDRDEEALEVVRQARGQEPEDLELIRFELRLLGYLQRYREALDLLEAIPAEQAARPDMRAEAADVYDALGFATLALEAYGPSAGLNEWRRRDRRRHWWRAGGPSRAARHRREKAEQVALNTWRTTSTNRLKTLRSATGQHRAAATGVVADLHDLDETRLRLRWARRAFIAHHLSGWTLMPAAVGVIAGLAHDMAHFPVATALLTAAACAVAGHVLLERTSWLVVSDPMLAIVDFRRLRFIRSPREPRPSRSALVKVVIGGIVGVLVCRSPAELGGWPIVAGVAVLSIAAVALGQLLVAAGMDLARTLALRRFRRQDPRGVALTILLDLLGEVRRPNGHNEMSRRRRWMQTLEVAALTLENDLPATFGLADPHTAERLRIGSRRAAAALRQLKYDVAAASPRSWPRIEAVLAQDIRALATGDFNRLLTAEPPAPPRVTRSRREIAVKAARTIVFAVLPLAVVLTAQPWLRFNETILNWARLGAIAWALLYVLPTEDSVMLDKIRTAFTMINIVRGGGDPADLDPRDTLASRQSSDLQAAEKEKEKAARR